MQIPITKYFLLFNYVYSEDALEVKYETESLSDSYDTHDSKKKFLHFSLPKNISNDQIKGVIIRTNKKIQSQPGYYETIQQPTSYFIPISALANSIRVKIGEGKYIKEEARENKMEKIRKGFEKLETEALEKIFKYLITESKEYYALRDSFKNLIHTLDFYTKFRKEYITKETITRLRSTKDVETIYIEIIDAILDESKITECLSKILRDCETITRISGNLELIYKKNKRKTKMNWHSLFYDALKVALEDKSVCMEIMELLKDFKNFPDLGCPKKKLDVNKLEIVMEKNIINILQINDTNSLRFKRIAKFHTELTFQEELKQSLELCVWHLQIQCSYFFNILTALQKICKSIQVEIPNIVNYENTDLEAYLPKFMCYINDLTSCGSRIHDEKYINFFKSNLQRRKLKFNGPSRELYDILVDSSVFLQFVLLTGPSSNPTYIYSGYYTFENANSLIPLKNSNTLMIYDSISKLSELKTFNDLVLSNEVENGNKYIESDINNFNTSTPQEFQERYIFV